MATVSFRPSHQTQSAFLTAPQLAPLRELPAARGDLGGRGARPALVFTTRLQNILGEKVP